MSKFFPAFAVLALLGAVAIAPLLFAPKVEASEAMALGKADRLQAVVPVLNCTTEVWPDVTARCLRSAQGATILEARLVTARR